MATPHQKLAALKARTIENGCTPGEVEAAKIAIDRLMAKHPELSQPEPEIFVFTFNEFNHKTAGATDWVKEGMRRAAEAYAKAAKDQGGASQEPKSEYRGARNPGDRYDESIRRFNGPNECTAFWLRQIMREEKPLNATAKLRVLARAFDSNGFGRQAFVAYMVDWGFNRETASTQWSRAKTQI